MNFNNASLENLGPSHTEYIIRDRRGRMVCVGFIKPLDKTNNNAKFSTLLIGVTLCREKGLLIMVIEGDSMNIMQAIMSDTAPS